MTNLHLIGTVSLILCALPQLTTGAAAAELRSGDAVHVPAGEVIDDDLYAAAREVIIDGEVRGDVVAAGSLVRLRGRVGGGVLAAGGKVLLEGTTGRSARLAGGEVRIDGAVGADLLALCGTCAVAGSGKVAGDLLVSGGELDLAGAVGRRLTAAGERVRLAGVTAAEAQVRAGSLRVEASAAARALTFGSREPASLAGEARLGRIERRPEWAPTRPSRLGGVLTSALMSLVTGLLLLWLFPGRLGRVSRSVRQRPASALLWGLLLAVVTPPVIVVGFLTVVAIPLAALLGAVYPFAMGAGYLASANLLGELLSERLRRPTGPAAVFAVGIGGLLLINLLPVLGPLVQGLASVAGLGGLWLLLRDSDWARQRFHGRGGLAQELR